MRPVAAASSYTNRPVTYAYRWAESSRPRPFLLLHWGLSTWEWRSVWSVWTRSPWLSCYLALVAYCKWWWQLWERFSSTEVRWTLNMINLCVKAENSFSHKDEHITTSRSVLFSVLINVSSTVWLFLSLQIMAVPNYRSDCEATPAGLPYKICTFLTKIICENAIQPQRCSKE